MLVLTNICKTELFNPRNPYRTPGYLGCEGAFVFLLFSFLFCLERGEWSFFVGCWWLLEFLFEMSKRLHTHVIHVKLLPTYPMYIYSPIERWFNVIPPPQKTLIGLNNNNNNHEKATNAGVRRNF